ncbi:MAG TPA: OsmC family protein [Sphingobacteriaceae bacterium]|nr:OsmC family protein [Sphingobacteriaceae bacterium]
MEIKLKKVNDAVHFEGTGVVPDVQVQIDGTPEIGGQNLGVRPMELVLMALGSCASLDFVTILTKQRQAITSLDVKVTGQRRDEAPRIFTAIHIHFELGGQIDSEKAAKAAELAVKKYCSVHDMLSAGGIAITYDFEIV